mmetsp:Transcript_84306/g.148031  ORF Transcript_84306/g.148031 Transcript_84306/m.148031 type:complete len:274 (-) Transcript_84306:2868-3689(-)
MTLLDMGHLIAHLDGSRRTRPLQSRPPVQDIIPVTATACPTASHAKSSAAMESSEQLPSASQPKRRWMLPWGLGSMMRKTTWSLMGHHLGPERRTLAQLSLPPRPSGLKKPPAKTRFQMSHHLLGPTTSLAQSGSRSQTVVLTENWTLHPALRRPGRLPKSQAQGIMTALLTPLIPRCMAQRFLSRGNCGSPISKAWTGLAIPKHLDPRASDSHQRARTSPLVLAGMIPRAVSSKRHSTSPLAKAGLKYNWAQSSSSPFLCLSSLYLVFGACI